MEELDQALREHGEYSTPSPFHFNVPRLR
jgi:hypothetical protein